MHKYILLAGLLLLTYFAKAQQNTIARIDSVMQVAYQRGVFNGNILVARKGKIIYKKAWGYADGRRKKLLTTDMRFDIGSISKEFNGTGIMLLKERGKLSLDDPISKFMPLLPPWAHHVKIRHLINYTSGIPLFDATSAETDNQILGNLMALKALSFEPGSAYIYNHYNVYLQERIIEKVSGLPYADFITENILKPCGMNNTIINYPVNGAGMARAFNNEFIETPYAQAMTGWLRLPVTDLYKWTENLHQYKVISKTSFKELAANFAGGESSLGSVGFDNEELAWHQHQGSNSNYEALFYSNIKEGITIVMMTNNQQLKVHGIKSAILAVLKNEAVTVPRNQFTWK